MTIEIVLLQVCPRDVLARDEMPRIEIQRLPRPLDHGVVTPLVPVRERDLQVDRGRRRAALERLVFRGEALREMTKRLEQPAIQQQSFRVIGIDLERALQTPPPSVQFQSLRNNTVPSATCASGLESSIARARSAASLAPAYALSGAARRSSPWAQQASARPAFAAA